MRHRPAVVIVLALLVLAAQDARPQAVTLKEYPLPLFNHPHDVAPAADGGIWYTPQLAGGLGWLEPSTGKTRRIPFGIGSQPHGVITAPDGTAWVTDEGLNAVVRVDPRTNQVTRYPLPPSAARAELNTAALDGRGVLWFTGQAGWYGRLDPSTGKLDVFPAPRGAGPYGMFAQPNGPVWFVSLAGGYLGRIDPLTAALAVIALPPWAGPGGHGTEGQGPRRVWLDSKGAPWVTGWYSGKLLRYDPAAASWKELTVPGPHPQPYAVYVDERDRVWISDFGGNAIHLYDPAEDRFTTYPIPSAHAEIRQLAGRPGEVWGAESGENRLLEIRF